MKNSILNYSARINVFMAIALICYFGPSANLMGQPDVHDTIQINCGGSAYAYDDTTSWEIKGNQFLFPEGADQMAIETGVSGIYIRNNYFYNIGILCAKFGWGDNTKHLTVSNNVIERVGDRQGYDGLLWTDGAFENSTFDSNTIILDAHRPIFATKSSLPNLGMMIKKNIIISDDPNSAFTNDKTGVEANDNLLFGLFNDQCFDNTRVSQDPLDENYKSKHEGYGASLDFVPNRSIEKDTLPPLQNGLIFENKLMGLIQEAASDTDTVWLEAGVYIENNQIDISEYDDITIVGKGRNLTIIRGAGNLLDTQDTVQHFDTTMTIFKVGNNFRIQDLCFDGQSDGQAGKVRGGISWSGKNNITIQRVDFHDLRYGYILFDKSDFVEISDCYMSNLGMNNMGLKNSMGKPIDDYLIKMGASDNVVIDSVIIDFAENSKGGIGIGYTDFGGSYLANNIVIKNCDIEGADTAAHDPGNPSPAFAIECQFYRFKNCKIIDNILRAGVSLVKEPTEGTSWDEDKYFSGGATYKTDIPIAYTENDGLYQSERYGKNFKYEIPASPGLYTVRLHFAEIYWDVADPGGPGSRVFNVKIEDQTYLSDYDMLDDPDIKQNSGGSATAVHKTYKSVRVEDDTLDIEFIAKTDNAKISGISVVREEINENQDVILSNQAEVDAFPYSTVTGTLTISDINDMDMAITNLDGLASLSKARVLIIKDNPQLNDISGLSSLKEVEGLTIHNNDNLTELNAFEKITSLKKLVIEENENLVDIDGLQSLTSVTGEISVKGNNALTSCCVLYNLLRVGDIGSVNISGNGANCTMEDILVNGPCKTGFAMHLNCGGENYTYRDLEWVNDAPYVTGGMPYKLSTPLDIENTEDDSLYQSERYGDLHYEIPVQKAPGYYTVTLHFAEIYWDSKESRIFNVRIENDQAVLDDYDIIANAGAPATAIVESFDNIYVEDDFLTIEFNKVKNNAKISGISIVGIEIPDCEGDVILSSQAQVDLFECTEIKGHLIIADGDITDLSPLNSIRKIHGDLKIENLDDLAGIDGFRDLERIGSDLSIGSNDNLKFIRGFSNLVSVLGSIQITDDVQDATLEVIEGFSALEHVNNDLKISAGQLSQITGFGNLTAVGGDFILSECNNLFDDINAFEKLNYVGNCKIQNNANLEYIDWLSALAEVENDLTIRGNPLLDQCCSLYTLINTANIRGFVDISNNGVSCTKDDILANGPCDGPDVRMHINCGGPEFEFEGTTWEDGQSFCGGTSYEKEIPIDGTENDKLYQSESYGPMQCQFQVPNIGYYSVRLHFAEIYWGVNGVPGGAGSRIFDVYIEDELFLIEYDIVASAGASATAIIKSFDNIYVEDGSISIEFKNLTDNAKISGIEIFSTVYDPMFSININTGGPAFMFDKTEWNKDQYFTGGTTYQHEVPIENTENDSLYQSERYGNMRYEVPVNETGHYDLNLHFAELYWGVNGTGGIGSRIFDVSIENDQAMLDGYDIVASAGAPATAIVESFNDIYVDDGDLTIWFKNVKDNAKISGIEVLSSTGSNARMGDESFISNDLSIQNEEFIRIYPNPTHHMFYLKSYQSVAFEADLILYDFLGRMTELGRHAFEKGYTTLEFNLDNYRLPEGVYVLRICDENLKPSAFKIYYMKR